MNMWRSREWLADSTRSKGKWPPKLGTWIGDDGLVVLEIDHVLNKVRLGRWHEVAPGLTEPPEPRTEGGEDE